MEMTNLKSAHVPCGTDLRACIEDLNRLVLEGRILEAFETYYAEEVVMQENELPPTVGKAANRAREQQFLDDLIAFRGAEVKAVAVDRARGVTFVEWFYDYTHREWGERTYHQVSVQRWKEGQIVHERFYYGS